MYKLHIQEHLFKSDITMKEISSGVSLEQAYLDTNPILGIESAVFIVDDTIVEDITYIPEDNTIVCVKLVPEDDRTGWNILGGALMFAGLVVTLASGGALWQVGVGLFSLGAGVVGVNEMLHNMKFDDADAQSMQGGSGGANQWNPVPVIYGEHFIAPDFAAPDYTETVPSGSASKADTMYLHQLYVLGHTPLIVDNISIGDTALLVRKRHICRAKIEKLSATTARVTDLTATGELLSTFLRGASFLTLEGFSKPQLNQQYRISVHAARHVDIRLDDEMSNILSNIGSDTSSGVSIGRLADSGVYRGVNLKLITDGITEGTPYPQLVNEIYVGLESKYAATHPPLITTPSSINKVDVVVSIPQGLYGVKGTSKKDATVSAVIQVKKVTDEIWDFGGRVQFKDYKITEARSATTTINLTTAGQYMVRVVKEQSDYGANDGCNMIQFTRAICYKVQEDPNDASKMIPVVPISSHVKDDFTFMALRIQASDQLNGTITNLNCTIRQGNMVYDKDYVIAPTTEVPNPVTHEYDKWFPGYSSNPASTFMSILTNKIICRYPIGSAAGWDSPELIPIDWDMLGEWYTFCDETGYTCDGVVNSTSTVRDELEKVCQTGRASFTIKDGLYTVMIEKPKDAVQLFSPRNTYNFSASRQYHEIFDGVRVKFTDKDLGYTSNETTVFPDGSKQEKFDEFSLTYVTSMRNAKRQGEYYYNVKTLRQETFTFSTDFEYLVCTSGDRIKFQHDVPLIGLASTRVKSLITSGSTIIGLFLDEYVTMLDDGTHYGIQVRAYDDDESGFIIKGPYLVSNGLATENTNKLMLTVPKGANEFEVGDILAYGLHGTETEDLLIIDISTGEDLTATITAVKYDEDIYELETFAEWEPVVVKAGSKSTGRGVNIPSVMDRSISNLQALTATASTSKLFNEDQPTTPYTRGDIWKRGVNMYMTSTTRAGAEAFVASDWERATSDTFKTMAQETFGDAFPEHRWFISPGGDTPILYSELFSVNAGSSSADNIFSDDEAYWDAGQAEGKLITPDPENGNKYNPTHVKAKLELGQTASFAGRYGRGAWLGEAYTNFYPNPEVGSATKSISLEAGDYVLQCFTGSMVCKNSGGQVVGTAEEDAPSLFTAVAGTYTFTTTDATYVSLTKTAFIPPYNSGQAAANSYLYSITVPRVEGVVDVFNKSTTFVPIVQLYVDTANYIVLGMKDDVFHIKLVGTKTSTETFVLMSEFEILNGEVRFSLEYDIDARTVTTILNGHETVLDTGTVLGYRNSALGKTFAFGYMKNGISYVFGAGSRMRGTPDKAYIGVDHTNSKWFNNQLFEVTYE